MDVHPVAVTRPFPPVADAIQEPVAVVADNRSLAHLLAAFLTAVAVDVDCSAADAAADVAVDC